MQDFYVYLHRKKTTGEVFYVGKGHGNRAYNIHGRSRWWNKIVSKHGLVVEIYIDNVTEWYAFEIEEELILKYGRRDKGNGSLVNCTDGGDGIKGYQHSDETKKVLSAYSSGINNPNADLTIYNLIHKSGLKFSGTRVEFREKYNIGITNLLYGTSNFVAGWTFQGQDDVRSRTDENIYRFLHQRSGNVFVGTRTQFKQEYGINVKPLFSSARRHKLASGWCLCNEDACYTFHIYTVYSNKTNSYFIGTKEEFKHANPTFNTKALSLNAKTFIGGWKTIERLEFCPYIP